MNNMSKKMNLIIKNLLLISFGVFLLASCQPYDDGPSVSLRGKEARFKGLWELSSIKVNEIDYTGQYLYNSMFVRFYIKKIDKDFIMTIVENNASDDIYAYSKMDFDKKKENCTLDFNVSGIYRDSVGPLFNLIPPFKSSNQWMIRHLAYEDMVWVCSLNDITYRLEFINIEK